MGVIAQPFGYLLRFLYETFGNYGWAIVGFTVIVNLILMPLTFKQQKSTIAMQKIQPQIAQIQKKYANDKDKQSQELMRVYQENNINPAGGCLPLLIQLPIIMVLYQVIIKPLTYMYSLSDELVVKLQVALGHGAEEYVQQIQLAREMTEEVRSQAEFAHIPVINFNFFGLDLSATPSFTQINALWIIPVLSALTSYAVSKLSQKMTNPEGSENAAAAQVNTMNKIMPLISAWFTFSFPAGIGLYWVMSNVVRGAQQFFINKYFMKQKAADPLVVEAEKPKKINMNNVNGSNKKKKKK